MFCTVFYHEQSHMFGWTGQDGLDGIEPYSSFKTGVTLKSLFQSMKVAFTSPRSQNIIPKTLFDFVPKDHGYILQK